MMMFWSAAERTLPEAECVHLDFVGLSKSVCLLCIHIMGLCLCVCVCHTHRVLTLLRRVCVCMKQVPIFYFVKAIIKKQIFK